MDYRDIPAEFEHAFDAFISIEMLEHVGSQVSCTHDSHSRKEGLKRRAALSAILQAGRLRAETEQCHCGRQLIHLPRGPVHRLSVSVSPSDVSGCVS